MPGPTLSIVTGHWNRHASMSRLAGWVAERTAPIDYELLVSDCSEVPWDPANVPEVAPFARVVRDWPKTTMADGYVKAFREARGEFVLWLNDDAEPLPNYAQAAVEFMRAHSDVGLGALYWRHGDEGPLRVDEWPAGVPYANFGIISRELGDRIGWWDQPEVRCYGVDNVISLRVWLAGLGVVGIPGARVVNHRVHDAQRRHNEATYVPGATAALTLKYGPRMDEVRGVVARFAHMQGPKEIRA